MSADTRTLAAAMQAIRTCSLNGCDRTHYARDMCKLHYARLWNQGKLAPLPVFSLDERLAAGLVRMPNGCLEWTKATSGAGYGQIRVNGIIVYTHRLAWELVNGPIPDGLFVCHHCDNPPCCDTERCLFLGTQADNLADMAVKGRGRKATGNECGRGHQYVDSDRICRICKKVSNARSDAKRRAS